MAAVVRVLPAAIHETKASVSSYVPPQSLCAKAPCAQLVSTGSHVLHRCSLL